MQSPNGHELIKGRRSVHWSAHLVRTAGLEPARGRPLRILSPVRLPVSPRPRGCPNALILLKEGFASGPDRMLHTWSILCNLLPSIFNGLESSTANTCNQNATFLVSKARNRPLTSGARGRKFESPRSTNTINHLRLSGRPGGRFRGRFGLSWTAST